MFTGLIESQGVVEQVRLVPSGISLRVATPVAADFALGESVAVNGVCLTVIAADARGFTVDVAAETLKVTTADRLRAGRRVNIERAMRADGRFGGHFVQGHVDGIGRVAARRPDGDAAWIDVDLPPDLAATSIHRGSIAIDGVSLTVAALAGSRIGIQLVPFTLAHTTLGDVAAGDDVNIETDLIGKYVARLLRAGVAGTEAARSW